MSSKLLLGSTAEAVSSPLATLRTAAVSATLGGILCGSANRPPSDLDVSINNSHTIWHTYARELSAKAKIDVPQLALEQKINRDKFSHDITTWLGSVAVSTLQKETRLRVAMYEAALERDLYGVVTMNEATAQHVSDSITKNWEEIDTPDLRFAPFVLGQLVSSALLNTTLRQHMQEEKALYLETHGAIR